MTNAPARTRSQADETMLAPQHLPAQTRLPAGTRPIACRASIDPMAQALIDYLRCPDDLPRFETSGRASADEGYFGFGDAIGFGRLYGREPARYVTDRMPETAGAVVHEGDRVRLPFDLSAAVTNLRQECYRQTSPRALERMTAWDVTQRAYYLLRPLLTVGVRKHLQKIRLSGWEKIAFPRWPVDFSVDTLMHGALALALKSRTDQGNPIRLVLAEGGVKLRHDDA